MKFSFTGRRFHIVFAFFALLLLLAFGWGAAPRPMRGDGVSPTNTWIEIYSANSLYNGRPLPVGAVVAVYDPQGVKCGEFVVHTIGLFGLMPCYGNDPLTPEDEGARPGDILHFTIDGQPAEAAAIALNGAPVAADTAITWNRHGDRWQIRLSGPVSVTPDHTLVETLRAGWTECGIKVAWSTSYERADAKFRVQRALSLDGPFTSITSPIKGRGAASNYIYCDSRVIPGYVYVYRLHMLPDDAITDPVVAEGWRYPLYFPALSGGF